MRAVDTNVVVRYVTDEDDDQSRRAQRLIDAGHIFITTTVVLEAEWVLRSVYRFGSEAVVAALREVARLPGVQVEDAARVSTAFDWAAAGMDLADALHLAGARDCTAFVSFDRSLAKTAARVAALPVVEP